MWPFRKKMRDDLRGIKVVKINGHKFTIRKLNPFLDFEADKIPQIFTDFYARKPKPAQEPSPKLIRQSLQDMQSVVRAGLVEPKLSPELLTLDDIFRFGDTGPLLYMEILAHSLNQFRGLKGVFFSKGIRRWLFTQWRNSTAEALLKLYSPTVVAQ